MTLDPWCGAAAWLYLLFFETYLEEQSFRDMTPPDLPYLICLADPSREEGASRWVGEGEAPSVQVKAREVQRT